MFKVVHVTTADLKSIQRAF